MSTRNVVELGYDRIAHLYHDRRVARLWTVTPDLEALTKRLAAGAAILDAGCGSGYIASILEDKGFRVTGIDISAVMLELARTNSPGSDFVKMNMKDLDFPRDSFDGVICFYSIFHNPRRYHLGILKGFRRVLKPGGLLAIHMGWGDWVGTEENWLGGGAPMYWSHYGRRRNVALIQQAKFDVITSRGSKQKDGTHLFVLAQKR